MAEIQHFKVVASLPSPLEPDSIYYVRVGQGYDQYVTNGVGVVVAYEANSKLGLESKVDKESGKQLSDENYTLDEKNKLASLENYDDSAIQTELDTKVDKIAGKGLSTEDFTSAEKDKLAELENFDDSVIQAELDTKVDKVAGKQLSTEDYSTEEKNKLSGIEAGAQVNSVTSVAGKTGAVTLNKADVGLSNVDNTSDSNKPVSTAQQAALNLKLNANANAVSASKLATPRTISLSGDASGSTSFDGSANATIVVQVADDSHNHVISNVDGLQTALDSKVDKVAGKQLSDENYTLVEKNKLAGVAVEATKNATDAQLRARATHTGVQPISSVSGLQSELDSKADTTYVNTQLATKVDKVAGKGLSSNDFTNQLRDKLASLESSHFRGTFTSKGDLELAIPVAEAGDYADVDAAGQDAERYIWDSSDSIWVLSTTKPAPLTAAQIKQMYESNPDTNPFDDAAEAKLEGVAAGATKNATDAQLRARATHTGTQPISTISGLEDELTDKVSISDTRLTNSREWTAATVSQAEAQAGTATTRRAWTAQRVRQAVISWWDSSTFKTKLDGIATGATKNATDAQLRDRATHTGTQEISTVAGLTASLDSKADQTSLDAVDASKVDKEEGKGLSTNDFTTTEKTKLSGIQAGATANATNAQLRDRATHTGVQPIASVDGLQDALGGKVGNTDSRLTNAREWTATVVSQAEAEAGTSTTARKWTAQRVRQAILGWWNGSPDKTKLDGIESGAQVNSVTSVAGKTGAVTLTHTDVNAAPTSHTHPLSQITGAGNLAALSTNASTANFLRGDGTWVTPPNTNTTYTEITTAEIDAGTATTLRTITGRRMKYALDKKADVSHTHTLSQITDAGSVAGISTNGSSANFLRGDGTWVTPPNTNTTYAEITTAEIDAGTASTLRTISGRRIKYALDKKSDTGHGHEISDVTGLQAAIDSKANTSTQVIAGTGLSGGGTLAANRTLSVNYGTTAGTAAQGNDSRLSNSREWTAAVVSQAEAEAGTVTTARKWTAQRVRQAIAAWWDSTASASGKTVVTGTPAQGRTALGLGNVDDTKDADKRVGSFVIHDTRSVVSAPDNVPRQSGLFEFKNVASVGNPPKPSSGTYAHVLTTNGWTADGSGGWPTQVSLGDALSFRKGSGATTWGPWREIISTDTTLGATGQSTEYPMTQKATTDALNLKADTSTQVIAGTGLSGGGNLSANRTLSVNYGTSAGTAAQGNDSRLSNSREWTASTVSQSEAEAGTAATRRAWTSQRVRQNVAAYTEPFTSGDKSKLDGIAAGAQVNVGTNLGSSGTGATRTITSSTGSNTSITYSAADVGAVPTARTITAGTGLTGGGNLTANRTLSVQYGTTAGTAAQGNDSRLSNSREWTASVVTQAEAEAGTATTARKWTSQRVAQAISALGLKIGTTASTAKAGNWTPTWSEVTGKPATFTPATHNHSAGEITSGVLAYARIPTIRHGDTDFANQALNTNSSVRHATVRTGGTVDDGTNSLQVDGGTRTDTLAAGGVQVAEESIDTDGNIQVRGEGQLKMGEFAIQYNAATKSLDFNFMET